MKANRQEKLIDSSSNLSTKTTRRHIPEDRDLSINVSFEVFTAMTMKNILFWAAAPCGSGLNRRDPLISCYSAALMMEVIRSSETSVQTRATRCYITEDDILYIYKRIFVEVLRKITKNMAVFLVV
jgi:hypothetical protein